MRRFFQELEDFFKKGDMVLLLFALVTSAFGLIAIASSTQAPKFEGNFRYIAVQIASIVMGVIVYAIMSSIDIESMTERRNLFVAFNTVLLLMLIPFGVDRGGNKSWLDIPGVPVMIQPAEICKITYIIIMAAVMNSRKNQISSLPSVIEMVIHLGMLVGLNLVLSKDMGVSLIFVFIFIGMTFAGGVHIGWFLAAITAIVVAIPVVFPFLGEHQQQRIMVLIDPSYDALGTGARYHAKINMLSLTGGGLTGQGLFNGNRTQGGLLYAQHTDYIFSSMGEELGFLGCVLIMIMEFAIIARCIWVGNRSQDYMRRLICYGVAAAMIFQVIVNTGMCMGVMPVIGLTLRLISYGGSSVVTIFAMLGLVSGSYARPSSLSHERYIQPYR